VKLGKEIKYRNRKFEISNKNKSRGNQLI